MGMGKHCSRNLFFRAGGKGQVVERWSGNHKDLSSSPGTTKKKKTNKGRKEGRKKGRKEGRKIMKKEICASELN
jgi:hypothetical protein